MASKRTSKKAAEKAKAPTPLKSAAKKSRKRRPSTAIELSPEPGPLDLLLGNASPSPPSADELPPAKESKKKRVRRPKGERGGSRGFGSMDPDKLREISRMGGKAAHAQGRAHEFAEGSEAVEAGRKGGKTISQDSAHMSEIGRKGARARHRKGIAGFFGA